MKVLMIGSVPENLQEIKGGFDNLSAACDLLLRTVSGKGFHQEGAATAHSDSE